jgi:sugar/nucleoside kinase (ribokinase family)
MAPAAKKFDVLGLGCAAVDDVLYVPSFPAVDGKVRVERTVRRYGGLTGAALVTAVRLGARCAYAGCLGNDEISQRAADNFTSEGVDILHAPRLPEARVVHSTIIVGQDGGSRNVFYEANGLIGAHESLPSPEVIRDTKVLFIDHYGMAGNLRAARLARSAGAAVVADLEDEAVPLFREVLELVDHLILSEEVALRISRAASAEKAAKALWQSGRAAVIVTCGSNGCWSVSEGAEVGARHHPAFSVEAADTTGCGDVFHGAYAAALARGDSLEERIRFSTAAAALKATRPGIPRGVEVEQFIRKQAPLSSSLPTRSSRGERAGLAQVGGLPPALAGVPPSRTEKIPPTHE